MISRDELAQAFRDRAVAHLAIDMQRFYCDENIDMPVNRDLLNYRHARRLVPAVDAFADAIRPVARNIWIVHQFDDALKARVLWGGKELPPHWRDKFPNWLAQTRSLMGKEKPASDMVMEKYSWDAFDRTALGQKLHARATRVILLSGVFKDVCVSTTALRARQLGYEPVIVDDLSLWSSKANTAADCGPKTWTRERTRDAGITWMRSRDILDLTGS